MNFDERARVWLLEHAPAWSELLGPLSEELCDAYVAGLRRATEICSDLGYEASAEHIAGEADKVERGEVTE
jgi:hypothetical protein